MVLHFLSLKQLDANTIRVAARSERSAFPSAPIYTFIDEYDSMDEFGSVDSIMEPNTRPGSPAQYQDCYKRMLDIVFGIGNYAERVAREAHSGVVLEGKDEVEIGDFLYPSNDFELRRSDEWLSVHAQTYTQRYFLWILPYNEVNFSVDVKCPINQADNCYGGSLRILDKRNEISIIEFTNINIPAISNMAMRIVTAGSTD